MASGDGMQPGELDPGYLFPPDVTGGLTDVGYDGGLSDSVYSYSGSSTLQDVVPGSSSLGLSDENGIDDFTDISSFADFPYDAVGAQSLSGVSDPPFASAVQSTPTPNSVPASNPLNSGLSALSKLGSSFAALFGNTIETTEPGIVPATGPGGAVTVPGTAVSQQTVLMALVILGGIILLLAYGGE